MVLHLDGLSLFGLLAVALMLTFYTLEDRWPMATLLFAGACGLASSYGFMQGAWPFGLVEGIWGVVALRKWIKLAHRIQNPTESPDVADAFMDDLHQAVKKAGPTTYAFPDKDGSPLGFVQIHRHVHGRILIHRLWAVSPGDGVGSGMLRHLCDLADHHGVEISLRPLPFGVKPFPMEASTLREWYSRHGFTGPLKRMVRKPQQPETKSEKLSAVCEPSDARL